MTLKPLFGRTLERFPGKLVDYVCIITTALGVATTLGFGAAQIGSGLEYLVQVPNTLQLQLGIIAAATILFLLSAVSGVDKGVRMLSNINIALAVFLVAAALFLGIDSTDFKHLSRHVRLVSAKFCPHELPHRRF